MTQIERIRKMYKNLNLKEQLTDDLKSKWYYQDRKWGLRINKKSVVFDDDFKFKVRCIEHHWNPKDFEELDETFEDEAFIAVDFYIDNEFDHTLMYCDEDRWTDNIEDILETVLVYIANHI